MISVISSKRFNPLKEGCYNLTAAQLEASALKVMGKIAVETSRCSYGLQWHLWIKISAFWHAFGILQRHHMTELVCLLTYHTHCTDLHSCLVGRGNSDLLMLAPRTRIRVQCMGSWSKDLQSNCGALCLHRLLLSASCMGTAHLSEFEELPKIVELWR